LRHSKVYQVKKPPSRGDFGFELFLAARVRRSEVLVKMIWRVRRFGVWEGKVVNEDGDVALF